MKLFEKNMIDYVDSPVADWEQGVELGSQLLISNKYVGQDYIDEIIKITAEHGPYYIIAPHIALLHVAPKENTKANAISFTYFKNPIKFKAEEHYHVNFCLALLAKDNSSHMDILQAVAMLFTNQDFLNELQKCSSKKELIKVFKKYDL